MKINYNIIDILDIDLSNISYFFPLSAFSAMRLHLFFSFIINQKLVNVVYALSKSFF